MYSVCNTSRVFDLPPSWIVLINNMSAKAADLVSRRRLERTRNDGSWWARPKKTRVSPSSSHNSGSWPDISFASILASSFLSSLPSNVQRHGSLKFSYLLKFAPCLHRLSVPRPELDVYGLFQAFHGLVFRSVFLP